MKKSIGAKTIVYPTPVFIIGTYDKKGNPNAMAAAWEEYLALSRLVFQFH